MSKKKPTTTTALSAADLAAQEAQLQREIEQLKANMVATQGALQMVQILLKRLTAADSPTS